MTGPATLAVDPKHQGSAWSCTVVIAALTYYTNTCTCTYMYIHVPVGTPRVPGSCNWMYSYSIYTCTCTVVPPPPKSRFVRLDISVWEKRTFQY